MQPLLELRHLTKRYGRSRGVEDISLNVEAGSVFGFLGPNGAGKTTTISMIMGFIHPTSGSIRMFGLDNAAHGIEARRDVGFLSSDMALDDHLTGKQALEYYNNVRGISANKDVSELAERLRCDLNRKIGTLSRGNRQKVALIAALVHKPKLLVLDEPTSGLDPLIQEEFNAIINEHKAGGGTAFISSHVLSEIQEICDQVAFIKEGKIIANQPLKQLLSSAPQKVSVTSKDKSLFKALKNLPGIHNVSVAGSDLTAAYTGHMNGLLAVLAKHDVQACSITETDLEEMFMSYYQKQGLL